MSDCAATDDILERVHGQPESPQPMAMRMATHMTFVLAWSGWVNAIAIGRAAFTRMCTLWSTTSPARGEACHDVIICPIIHLCSSYFLKLEHARRRSIRRAVNPPRSPSW